MIQVKNLSYTYPGSSQQVLYDLNFDIQQGEIFGFLGPSGAGKTTTQKILYRILHNYQGEILIKGRSLHEWGKDYLEQIGVGFELPNHYLKLSGRENLELFGAFYPKEKRQNLDELFEMVGLSDAAKQQVGSYSKGMKMRLNFIRAIMHNPDILFFDEPTAGLDPVNAHKIKQHILDLKGQGKTIFITTHNMNSADELCDRVSFIVDGRLQLTEVPAVLKHRHGQDVVKVEATNAHAAEFALEGLGKNADFLNFLQHNEVLRINTLEATLEEVFIQVTGQALKA